MKRRQTCGTCVDKVPSATAGEWTVVCAHTGLIRPKDALCNIGMYNSGKQLEIEHATKGGQHVSVS
jgi:hypothetical protein